MKNNNKIAILGGGHGAHAMAADLTLRGFSVNMYEMPEYKHNLANLFQTETIEVTGVIQGTVKLEKVTSDIEEAIKDVKYIVLVVPAFAHTSYAKLLKGKVNKEQIIILYPGAFGSLLLKEVFGEDDGPVITEVNNLPYDTRSTSPGKVNIFGLNKVNIAFLPAEKSEELLEDIRRIHPFEKVYADVLECGLSIVNPAVHAGPCLLNIGSIEYWARGDFYVYEHGFTPSAAKVNIQIDEERKAIGRKLGYKLTPIEDFTGMQEGYDWKELYLNIHGNISLTPIVEPNDINSRYLTEDAPYGLVPWSTIAKEVGVVTPIIDAVVNVYSVIHERSWWEEGRTANVLGLAGMTVEEIKEYVKTGKKK